jgi:hypothetical protein
MNNYLITSARLLSIIIPYKNLSTLRRTPGFAELLYYILFLYFITSVRIHHFEKTCIRIQREYTGGIHFHEVHVPVSTLRYDRHNVCHLTR